MPWIPPLDGAGGEHLPVVVRRRWSATTGATGTTLVLDAGLLTR